MSLHKVIFYQTPLKQLYLIEVLVCSALYRAISAYPLKGKKTLQHSTHPDWLQMSILWALKRVWHSDAWLCEALAFISQNYQQSKAKQTRTKQKPWPYLRQINSQQPGDTGMVPVKSTGVECWELPFGTWTQTTFTRQATVPVFQHPKLPLKCKWYPVNFNAISVLRVTQVITRHLSEHSLTSMLP